MAFATSRSMRPGPPLRVPHAGTHSAIHFRCHPLARFGNRGRNLHFLAGGCRSPEAASLPGFGPTGCHPRGGSGHEPRLSSVPVNIQHFFYWRDHARTFGSMAALRSDRATLTGGGEPVQIDEVETTADLFRVLAVNKAQGRGFLPGEDQPGRNNVAIITDSLWRRRFHAASNLIGQSITLDGKPATVVGILRPDFRFPKGDDLGALSSLGKRIEIFRPLQEIITGWDGDYDYFVVGRLNPNTRLPQGLAELNRLTKQLIAANKVVS